ncbi:hypothetical protein ACJX0J_038747 [Zea mays]
MLASCLQITMLILISHLPRIYERYYCFSSDLMHNVLEGFFIFFIVVKYSTNIKLNSIWRQEFTCFLKTFLRSILLGFDVVCLYWFTPKKTKKNNSIFLKKYRIYIILFMKLLILCVKLENNLMLIKKNTILVFR